MAKHSRAGPGRKRRRPEPFESSAKRASITVRITKSLRGLLESEAKRNGRSMTAELESRLSGPISDPRINEWARAFATLMSRIEQTTGRHLDDDPFTNEAMAAAVKHYLSVARPEGDLTVPEVIEWLSKSSDKELADLHRKPEIVGVFVASSMLTDLQGLPSPRSRALTTSREPMKRRESNEGG